MVGNTENIVEILDKKSKFLFYIMSVKIDIVKPRSKSQHQGALSSFNLR